MCTELEDHLHFDYVRLAWDTGFCFDNSKTKHIFDFNALGLVDIDKVSVTRDIATVEKHIPTILQFQLDEELAKILEPSFVKVFRLCQFAVQYLRFCKKYLDNTVVILKKDLLAANEENTSMKTEINNYKSDINHLKQKNTDLKETISCFNTTASFKCNECTKVFYSEEYLTAHQKRRHDSSEKSLIQTESDKLQLEIKELKQRLNNTEKYIQIEKDVVATIPNNDALVVKDNNAELQNKFDKLKEHIEKELNSLKDESFFKNIYEKWFDEAFQKIKNTHSLKNDNAQISNCIECGTQTNFVLEKPNAEEKKFVNHGTSTSSTSRQASDAENEDKKHIIELEEKLKFEAEAHREKLENVVEQKITGSLERLETKMSTFWNKLNSLEIKKEQELKLINAQIIQNKSIQNSPKTAPTVAPRALMQSRYLSPQKIQNTKQETSETESDTDSQYESSISKHEEIQKTPPKPVPRMAKLLNVQKIKIAQEIKPKNSLINIKATKPAPTALKRSKNELKPQIAENLPNKIRVIGPKSGEDVLSLKNAKKINVIREIKDMADSTDDESSIQEDDSEMIQLDQKSSNVSTIAKRSLTSLKNAATDSDLTEGLRRELNDMVSLRLKEIGVAPQWKGIPIKSYNRALEIIDHQATLIKKNVSNFDSIREEIVVELDVQIQHLNAPKNKQTSGSIGMNKTKIDHERQPQKRIKSKPTSSETIQQDNFFPQQDDNKITEIKPIHKAPLINQRKSATIKEYYDTSDASTIDNKMIAKKVGQVSEIALIETPSRSVLKSPLQSAQWPQKKKVIFDLESDESSGVRKNEIVQKPPVLLEGGSTTSIASSVLDGSKVRSNVVIGKENVDIGKHKDDDISDWDVSDILT